MEVTILIRLLLSLAHLPQPSKRQTPSRCPSRPQDQQEFTMRIALCYPVQPRHVRQIAEAARDAEVVEAGQERITTEILDADIFIGHSKVHSLPWDEVVRRGRLQWIQSSAAGLDHCLAPAVIDSEILVTSASGLFADQV